MPNFQFLYALLPVDADTHLKQNKANLRDLKAATGL